MNRRRFLLSTAALAALSPAYAQSKSAALTALLDSGMQRALAASPELLTMTGLDTGPNAAARGKLDDRSAQGVEAQRAIFADLKTGLAAYDPKTLSGMDWVNHQSAVYMVDTTLESYSCGFGDPNVGVAVPYIVSQLSGSYRNVPSFLATQHPVDNASDAEAYLSRLSAFAVQLDQETDRVKADFAKGVVPPNFILKTTLTQFAEMTGPSPSRSELVGSLVRRTGAKQIAGEWEARAAKIVEADVYPALNRQADVLKAALPTAPTDAGVWRLPNGEAYYRYCVRAATTSDLSGGDIHQLGLELVADLTAKAEAILESRGLTKGTVAQRIAELRRDPSQLYSDSPAGRAAIIADLERMVESIRGHLPDYFGQLPKAALKIQRMPLSIEAGASGATYQPPSLDGSRPGLFQINLRNMAEWPRIDLPTLVYHEGIPGHHLQNALANEVEGLPMLRRMPLFSGYSEGWAVYAEQLADEMGVYASDPLGRLGYIASMMFRAARLVLDSGLHHQHWNREQANAYMANTLGNAETEVVREVERYCVEPAQACSYMLGWRAWTEARTKAKATMGSRFDIRGFHDAGLLKGEMPLDVLTRVIADWSRA